MIALATVTIPFYLLFLILEKLIFNSRNFETTLPWGSLDKKVDFVHLLVKIILSISFVYDKAGRLNGYISLVCAVLYLFIIFTRV